MEIKGRIRAIRKDLGLTQVEFSEKLSISQSHLRVIEKASIPVNEQDMNHVVSLICQIYNANMQWLLTGEGDMYTHPTRDTGDCPVPAGNGKYKMSTTGKDDMDKTIAADEGLYKLVPVEDIADDFTNGESRVKKTAMDEGNIPKLTNGEKYPSRQISKTDVQIIMAYLQLEPKQKARIKNMIGHMDKNRYKTVPIIELPDFSDTPFHQELTIDPILSVSDDGRKFYADIPCDFALELVGHGMFPMYHNGDYLLINKQTTLENGDPGIIQKIENGKIVKTIFKIYYKVDDQVVLKSLNPAFKDIFWPAAMTRIFGKVIGRIQN